MKEKGLMVVCLAFWNVWWRESVNRNVSNDVLRHWHCLIVNLAWKVGSIESEKLVGSHEETEKKVKTWNFIQKVRFLDLFFCKTCFADLDSKETVSGSLTKNLPPKTSQHNSLDTTLVSSKVPYSGDFPRRFDNERLLAHPISSNELSRHVLFNNIQSFSDWESCWSCIRVHITTETDSNLIHT